MTSLAIAINNTLNEIKHEYAATRWIINSPMYNSIVNLDYDKFFQLQMLLGDDDYLLHVDTTGCTINHGNVGSQGIRYEFN